MEEPARETQAVWRALMTVSKSLLEEIESDLKVAELPPLAWYDVLLEVDRAGDDGLRPYELQERLLLPQYGTSRLLDRMDAAGLIQRELFGPDKRGQVITATPDGQTVRKQMWKVYGAFLANRVGERLSKGQAVALVGLLKALRQPDSE